MLLCLHVEFVFMLMPFTWLTDDLLRDNPPSKLRLSISTAQICLFCEKYENPRNLGIVRACADKSHLCSREVNFLSQYSSYFSRLKELGEEGPAHGLCFSVFLSSPGKMFCTDHFNL